MTWESRGKLYPPFYLPIGLSVETPYKSSVCPVKFVQFLVSFVFAFQFLDSCLEVTHLSYFFCDGTGNSSNLHHSRPQ